MPCHLSGSGRSDLVSSTKRSALHRQFAGLGAEQGALGADHIADIPALELLITSRRAPALQED